MGRNTVVKIANRTALQRRRRKHEEEERAKENDGELLYLQSKDVFPSVIVSVFPS
jgi:hypothetical protein